MIALVALLSGCETMSGLGKDVEKAGEWVQEKAK
jgi:predicted small secreted protein